MLKKNK